MPDETIQQHETTDIFLTPIDLRKRWRKIITLGTLDRWRCSKTSKGPVYLRIGGRVVYKLSDVEKFEQEKRIVKP